MAVDEAKLQQLLGKMLGEVGAAMGIGLVLLGDKFGLYKALAAAGPLTSAELAYQFRLRDRAIFDFTRAGAGLRRRERTGIFSRDVRNRCRCRARSTQGRGSVPHRRRCWLA